MILKLLLLLSLVLFFFFLGPRSSSGEHPWWGAVRSDWAAEYVWRDGRAHCVGVGCVPVLSCLCRTVNDNFLTRVTKSQSHEHVERPVSSSPHPMDSEFTTVELVSCAKVIVEDKATRVGCAEGGEVFLNS